MWRSCRTHTYAQHLLLFYNEQHKQVLVCALFVFSREDFSRPAAHQLPSPWRRYLSTLRISLCEFFMRHFTLNCLSQSGVFTPTPPFFLCRKQLWVPPMPPSRQSPKNLSVQLQPKPRRRQQSTESRWQRGEKETEGFSPGTVGNVLTLGSCWFFSFVFFLSRNDLISLRRKDTRKSLAPLSPHWRFTASPTANRAFYKSPR